MTWRIPVTIVELGRSVIIEAETKAEALRKLRAREWVECTDPAEYRVTKVGRCEPE